MVKVVLPTGFLYPTTFFASVEFPPTIKIGRKNYTATGYEGLTTRKWNGAHGIPCAEYVAKKGDIVWIDANGTDANGTRVGIT
jgi:hypothetical protein